MTARRRTRLAVAALVLVATTLGACSSDDEPTPEELRRERVETRLNATFPRAQASCILNALDDETLLALDRDQDLAADSTAMQTYGFAVRACVADAEASGDGSTTTSDATTTTEATDG